MSKAHPTYRSADGSDEKIEFWQFAAKMPQMGTEPYRKQPRGLAADKLELLATDTHSAHLLSLCYLLVAFNLCFTVV